MPWYITTILQTSEWIGKHEVWKGERDVQKKTVKYSKHIPAQKIPQKRKPPRCDRCTVMACWPQEPEDIHEGPNDCPRKNYPDIVAKAKETYMNDPFHRKMQLAGVSPEGMSSQTPPGGSEINMKMTRVEELITFCTMMSYKKIGFAHCIGVSTKPKSSKVQFSEFVEQILDEYLTHNGIT